MKKILAAIKDLGGMQAVLPVVTELEAKGHTVHLVASGKAAEQLAKAGRAFFSAVDAQPVLDHFGTPDLLLTSMCSDGGVGRELASLLRGKAVTVAVQDQWGARLLTDWAEVQYRPDFLVVGDEAAKRIVMQAWPKYAEYRIVVIGYAALDALKYVDQAAARKRVRLDMGVAEDTPLFYYSGQVLASSTALRELLQALSTADRRCAVVAAMHPRMDQSDLAAWNEVVSSHLQLIVPVQDKDKPSETDLIAACDTVVSMFGTALTTASALRKQAISIMYPGSDMRTRYQEVTGGLMDEHPLVIMGAAAGPRNFNELVAVCKSALSGKLANEQEPLQRAALRVGDSATLIAAFVSGL